MSAPGREHHSPLLRTLYLTLWMGGIGLILCLPLFIGLSHDYSSEHIITWLLAVSTLLPTFGAAVFASIPKTSTRQYILSAVIAILVHGAISFVIMAAYSLLLSVENLSQVILLATSWIPAILLSTVAPLVRLAKQKRLAKRGKRLVFTPLQPRRATALSILGGILFSAGLYTVNGILYILASADSGSVVAGLIFPLIWGLFAVHRPRTPRPSLYRLFAILTGALLFLATFAFAAALHMAESSIGISLPDIVLRLPLTVPAIPLSLASLSLTTLLPLWVRTAPESAAVESIG